MTVILISTAIRILIIIVLNHDFFGVFGIHISCTADSIMGTNNLEVGPADFFHGRRGGGH
jgi:hypothetical protein